VSGSLGSDRLLYRGFEPRDFSIRQFGELLTLCGG
jgi:hypothetical protein